MAPGWVRRRTRADERAALPPRYGLTRGERAAGGAAAESAEAVGGPAFWRGTALHSHSQPRIANARTVTSCRSGG